MGKKKNVVAEDAFVPAPPGWYNYYEDWDNVIVVGGPADGEERKYRRTPCPGFIYQGGQWVAATIEGGYIDAAHDSANFVRTGREEGFWVGVSKDEAVGE